ncbi:MAG: hypothetical protein ABIE22_05165 [archaeon]
MGISVRDVTINGFLGMKKNHEYALDAKALTGMFLEKGGRNDRFV